MMHDVAVSHHAGQWAVIRVERHRNRGDRGPTVRHTLVDWFSSRALADGRLVRLAAGALLAAEADQLVEAAEAS